MGRIVSLDHRLARLLSAPGPARRLGQELERPLAGTVIRRIERHIRRQDAHQRHIGEIMSLHDHLGPHQDVRLFIGKG